MKRFGRKYQKRLAKLVTVALMCTGGGLFSLPHVASAAEVKEVTWDGSLTSSQTPTNVTPDNAAMELSGTPKVYAHITDTYVTQGYKTLTLIPGGTTVYVMAGYNNTKDALSGFTLNFNGGIWNYSYGAFSEKGGNGEMSKTTRFISKTAMLLITSTVVIVQMAIPIIILSPSMAAQSAVRFLVEEVIPMARR